MEALVLILVDETDPINDVRKHRRFPMAMIDIDGCEEFGLFEALKDIAKPHVGVEIHTAMLPSSLSESVISDAYGSPLTCIRTNELSDKVVNKARQFTNHRIMKFVKDLPGHIIYLYWH